NVKMVRTLGDPVRCKPCPCWLLKNLQAGQSRVHQTSLMMMKFKKQGSPDLTLMYGEMKVNSSIGDNIVVG
ncbi:Hypothetical predicted protein, partial [Olea europaea subsp. europaea]